MTVCAETMVYVATCRTCGGWVLLSVDIPENADDTAKEVAHCIRSGHEVSRRLVDEARTMPMCDWDCAGRVKATKMRRGGGA